MPRTRVKVSEILVLHLIELGVELNKLTVLVAMERSYVVTRPEPQRTPYKRYFVPCKDVARITDMTDVFQLERNMVHTHLFAFHEIDRVVIGVAPHEYEKIFDPI